MAWRRWERFTRSALGEPPLGRSHLHRHVFHLGHDPCCCLDSRHGDVVHVTFTFVTSLHAFIPFWEIMIFAGVGAAVTVIILWI